MRENLSIVRDCYWAMPSGDRYVIDENHQLSSQAHGLYKSFNANDSEYVVASDSGEIRYYGRLEYNNLQVDAVDTLIRAECQPEGSAVLYINSKQIGVMAVSTVDNHEQNFELTDEQRTYIHDGRILSNYDYFEVKVGSANAQPHSFTTPDIWLDAGDAYRHIDTSVYPAVDGSGVVADGEPVSAWVSKGNSVAMFENDYGDEYKPIYSSSALNGQPALRFWNPSGMFLHYDFASTETSPLLSKSGEIYVVSQSMDYPSSDTYLFEGADSGAGADAYIRLGFRLSTDELKLAWRRNVGVSSYDVRTFGNAIPSGVIKSLHAMSNDKKHFFNIDGSGSTAVGTNDGTWFWDIIPYTTEYGAHMTVGNTWDGNNPLNADYGFDGYIAEILIYEQPLSSGERFGVSNYIYDKYGVGVEYTPPTMKLYNVDIAYSGDSTWDNHETGLPNVTTDTFLPTLAQSMGNAVWSGDYANINTGLGAGTVDDEWMELYVPSERITFWTNAAATPSSVLSLEFGEVSGIPPLTQITRAQLSLRMSLPPSGQGDNVRDAFEINGYSARYKNQDHREDSDLVYVDSSMQAIYPGYGYFLYGKGDIVEQSGFMTYTTELNFLDPTRPSGDFSSTTNANVDMLTNMDFHLIGIPSGTQLSAAELQIEYPTSDTFSLYTVGSVSRCAASSTVDAGTVRSYAYGDGGWHHRGWRLRGPTVIEEDVFTNFYSFSEGAGNTRTYPETCKAYYFPTGDEDLTVYGDYVKLCPYGTNGDEGDVTPLLVDPQRREYYRDPIDTNDLTPSYELPTLRDTALTQPSYYRNMIYHSESLGFFDGDLDEVNENSINWNSVSQVYFDDRMGLGVSFTLYFMLYRDYGFQSYGRFFHRGLTEKDGIGGYEIYGDLEMDRVRFTVKGANNLNNKVEVEIDRNTVEPILVWFTCGYETEFAGNTSLHLNVHDDIKNYFGADWKRASKHFSGLRKQYTEQTATVTRPALGGTETITWGGPRTAIGTLETLTFFEQLSRKIYLHRSSICEFAYHGSNAIDIDWETSSSTVYNGYDVSEDKEKHFFKTRLCNSQYMQPNPSGVNWVVPPGSGEAQWSTTYNIQEWTDDGLQHSVFNPISTAGTNNVVAPSAMYIDMSAAHNTDHPSGVSVYVDVEFDSGTTDKWKVAHAEFTIPSGGTVYLQYEPIDFQAAISKHINMAGGPIRYSDLENLNVRVTTRYPGIGEDEYYGDFTIHSLNVSFDSYCVAATGIADLELYTEGGINILGDAADTSLDLFVQGKVTIEPPDPTDGTQNLDLYIHGAPHVASGDIMPLYVSGVRPTDPTVDADGTAWMPLYIQGLDPPEASGDMDLYIWGTDFPAIREHTTLFIESNLDPDWMLPLYLHNDDTIPTANSGVNLFQTGSIGENNNMSLYIAQRRSTGTLNLFTANYGTAPSSMPLFITGSGAPPDNNLDLYTHGF